MQRKISVEKINEFTGHAGNIYALYVSKNSRAVFTGASDGYVVEWNLEKPLEGRLICRLNQPVYSIYFHELTQQLWIGVASGNVHVVDLKTKEEIKNLAVHQLGVFDIKGAGNTIYVAGGDGCISAWDAQTMELLVLKKISEKSCRCIAIQPQGLGIAAGFSDFSLAILDKNLVVFHHELMAHQQSVFSLAFSPDGLFLLSGGRDAFLNIWAFDEDKRTVKLDQGIAAHNLHVHHISVQTEGDFFLSSSMDKTIKIWSLHDFSLLKVIDKTRNESHVNSVNKIAWINEHEFVSISDDKKLMHWRVIS
ncbi:MAG: WD40 repeat domain-containing protein [bacterium]|nr:WD40 repeat domain-containing protein [bacterium]